MRLKPLGHLSKITYISLIFLKLHLIYLSLLITKIKILKYENLNQELKDISLNLGFNFIGLNVRAKSGFREELNISNEDRRVIYNTFASSNADCHRFVAEPILT